MENRSRNHIHVIEERKVSKIIFFDTETKALAVDRPNQDVLIQLAYLAIDKETKSMFVDSSLIRPDNLEDFSPLAMSMNHLVPEMFEEVETKETNQTFQEFKDLLGVTLDVMGLGAL